jgi:hypothetical protein
MFMALVYVADPTFCWMLASQLDRILTISFNVSTWLIGKSVSSVHYIYKNVKPD